MLPFYQTIALVIIAVMVMLLSFSFLLDVHFTPDARQVLLDTLAKNPNSLPLKSEMFDFSDDIVELKGVGEHFIDKDRLDQLRKMEIVVLQAESNSSVSATFDISDETKIMAWYSFFMTFIVTSLLAILSLSFSRDAYFIMIRPIEQMKNTVQKLSENPFLHLDRINKQFQSQGDSETDILQVTITKMARLLQVGFGSAGAEIIAKNLSDGGELNPMVPGVRVHAIFGFCDIRDFTAATESLQEDVMPFVNKVADIVHKCVIASGGAPNKNIGDAFLLVWKLTTYSDEIRSDLQKNVFDASLLSCYEILEELNQIGTFSFLIKVNCFRKLLILYLLLIQNKMKSIRIKLIKFL
uniref:Guanylate cyclase domain-containing protein n=1 Tax=Corethron hystrix TaxID=216773 RepID=A0A7S1BM55_9STRA|mmetsp:Transcript_33842/g.78142  ORF Transcript_33842/g.78142 Transcript_33842/m.78142 type:complete len:353 (+) Transcript_33842:128-1186(+)